jgi:hypothetical protein
MNYVCFSIHPSNLVTSYYYIILYIKKQAKIPDFVLFDVIIGAMSNRLLSFAKTNGSKLDFKIKYTISLNGRNNENNIY